MSLIFDGRFQGTERWISRNAAFGAWKYSCLLRPDSCAVVSAPGGRSGYAGKFTIRAGDLCNSSSDARAMLDTTIAVQNGSEKWYSLSIYFPADWQTSGWGPMLTQIKRNIDSTHFSYIYAIYAGPSTSSHLGFGWKTSNNPGAMLDLGAPQTGWNDFLIRIKYSGGYDGFAHVYRNGSLVARVDNIQTLPNTAYTDQDWDIGIYEGSSNNNYLYHYNALIGTTRADVEQGAYVPPPPTDNPPVVEMGGLEKAFMIVGGTILLKEIMKR